MGSQQCSTPQCAHSLPAFRAAWTVCSQYAAMCPSFLTFFQGLGFQWKRLKRLWSCAQQFLHALRCHIKRTGQFLTHHSWGLSSRTLRFQRDCTETIKHVCRDAWVARDTAFWPCSQNLDLLPRWPLALNTDFMSPVKSFIYHILHQLFHCYCIFF